MKKNIKHKNFIHHNNSRILNNIREVIFGTEDGIVSTLGALTGIAVATDSQFTVIISGLVIISVESISMGVGSYISSKLVKDVEDRKLYEEKMQLKGFPEEEKKELFEIFRRDGWPSGIARKMADTASQKKSLMLKEMAYRELLLIPGGAKNNFQNGTIMFFSYVIGGTISLLPYFFLQISTAIIFSIIFAALGLFILGLATSKFTVVRWWKNGLRILLLGAISTLVGFVVGQLANYFK